MNMTLGCREEVGKQWFYYLMDGTKMTKEEWTSTVKGQIYQKGHEAIVERIKGTVSLWAKDNIEEKAMYIYASKYCTNINMKSKQKVCKQKISCQQMTLL